MPKIFSLGFVLLCLISSSMFGQDSLGEIARKYRAKDASTASQISTSNAAPGLTPGATNSHPDISSIGGTQYESRVQTMLSHEKFDELDQLAAAERASKGRFVGGGWRLYTLYLGLASPVGDHTTDSDWVALIERLKRWQALKPNSITPRVASAEAYVNYAWQARGKGYADQVTSGGWDLFAERVQTAKKILQEAQALKEKCPQWYRTMQWVALAEGWNGYAEDQLLQQAISFEPDYYYYYQAHARYLLPKWYGEEGDVAKFAETAADRLGGSRGDMVYFRIASEVNCECEGSPRLLWPRIQKGYAAVKEQFGVSNWHVNDYAYMAVHYEDAEVARQMLLKIGDDWDPSVWGTEQFFQNSKAWASETSGAIAYNAKLTAEFTSKYSNVVTTCAANAGVHSQKIGLLLQIAENGAVEGVLASPMIKDCVSQKLQTAVFSAPPRAHYGVPITISSQ